MIEPTQIASANVNPSTRRSLPLVRRSPNRRLPNQTSSLLAGQPKRNPQELNVRFRPIADVG
jgi:hypothetical protein